MDITVNKIVKHLVTKTNALSCKKALFNVITTPSIKSCEKAKALVISQVHHSAVKMFLVAIKSFVGQFGECKIELIDDGSLTKQDLNLLTKHIIDVKIINIKQIDTYNCPKGSCWERLCYLLSRTEDHYVIQLDSDTVTLGDLQEINQQVKENKAFTIGGPKFPEPVSIDYMADLAASWNNSHVQAKAEKNLKQLTKLQLTYYLRGCAAFSGFPKGCNLLPRLSEVSKIMQEALGAGTWQEWGTEQFTSNVMLSFCDDGKILEWPKYHNHGFPDWPNAGFVDYLQQVSVIHFIGAKRFSNNLYAQAIKHSIQNMRK